MRRFLLLMAYTSGDTFRQHLPIALGGMYAIIIFLFVYCIRVTTFNGAVASVSISGSNPMTPGELTYTIPEFPKIIVYSLFLLTVVLTLISTAHLVPEKLSPGMLSMLLARPIPRAALFAGILIGILSAGFTLQTIFLVAAWTVYSLKCGAADLSLLGVVIPTGISFAGIFTFLGFLEIAFRKHTLAAGIALAYSVYGSDLLARLAHAEYHTVIIRYAAISFYYILPPVSDLNSLSVNILTHSQSTAFPLVHGVLSFGIFFFFSILIFRRVDY